MIEKPVAPSLPAQLRGDSRLILGNERTELGNHVFVGGWRGLALPFGGLALVAVIALLDYVTGPGISFAIF